MAGRAVRGNLPTELTGFVGRRTELGEVKRLLATARLVTLVGVGGTGKTRLALRAAEQVRRSFPDGTWFVDLTELQGPIAQAVEDAEVLAYLVVTALGLHDRGGVAPLRRLTDHLADRRVLLVLDNCEHLLAPCAVLVDELARSCPGIKIMATSREPLAVRGEVLFEVPPLPLPAPGEPVGPPDAQRCEAITLFAARARARKPDFDLTVENMAAVVELCHRLDGLPLAIELAAARVRVLTPRQILDRLTDRFDLLSRGSRGVPARQRTLRACMDWSFELCGTAERLLWARLSTFVGGFELDAVEGVCADDELPAADMLGLVIGLLEKSVAVRDDGGPGRGDAARYRMLDTVRDFGRDRRAEAGEDAELRRRHADWYLRLVTRAAAEYVSDRQFYWTARLNQEHANLGAAVDHGLVEEGPGETAMRIGVAVPLVHWFARGNLGEVRRWLDLALARPGPDSETRARALLVDSNLAIVQGDQDVGLRLLAEGDELARRLGSSTALATAAYVRGVSRMYGGDLPGTIHAFQ